MVELMLLTPGSIHNIQVKLDVLDVEIPTLLGFHVQDGNNFLVDNATNHLWNCIITNKNPLKSENILKIKLKTKCDRLYVPLSRTIQLFCTMEKLQNLTSKISHPQQIYYLPKTAGTKAVTTKTLRN